MARLRWPNPRLACRIARTVSHRSISARMSYFAWKNIPVPKVVFPVGADAEGNPQKVRRVLSKFSRSELENLICPFSYSPPDPLVFWEDCLIR